jgi:hypothetical protein
MQWQGNDKRKEILLQVKCIHHAQSALINRFEWAALLAKT